MDNITPMMSQYIKIKNEHQDSILFFRLGDFYEMFYEDAKVCSKELDLVLTGKSCGNNERAPMCGVPFHSVDSYIAKLVSRGYKIAICEQTEDPSTAKKIVKREVVRIITPGTVIESSMLDESRNNYLASFYCCEDVFSAVFTDISTGCVYITSKKSENFLQDIMNEFAKYSPSEVIISKKTYDIKGVSEFFNRDKKTLIEVVNEELYDYNNCKDYVAEYIADSDKYLSTLDTQSVCAFGICLNYLSANQKSELSNIRNIEIYSDKKFMTLNYSSRRNLELTETMRNREKKGTLLWVLDKTKCSLGKRKLRSFLDKPLINYSEIISRQNAVSELYSNMITCDNIRESLSGINDIERIMARITYATANAKELRSLAESLRIIPEIKGYLSSFKTGALSEIYNRIDTLEDVFEIIDQTIVEDPPFTVREGNIIKKGFDEELDSLKSIEKDSMSYIDSIIEREKEKTGITKLKIGYNRVFGYFIEVTNSFKDLVPETYIRKQTLSNCERYITQELKELETKILGAKEKSVRIEYEIFCKVRDKVASQYDRIQRTADAIADLDAFCSLAHVAKKNNYVCPNITTDGKLSITDGRHPVVELMLSDSLFVPNDTKLDNESNRCAIITGPNMAGKSTYMRQVALIVLMAQIGSFVPASKADISICDSIYTRVGASDDLASGQSTFMVEMSEVADILEKATKDSLIIYDEIGRGTSTYDGMSIAKAVLEFTVNNKKIGAKTLFATHYHELTELENIIEGVKNYNIAVKKRGDDITFLRRIIRGPADGSFGVDVAKLAGVPNEVVNRAKIILNELESTGKEYREPIGKVYNEIEEDFSQLSFSNENKNALIEEIKNLDVNTLTPIEALTKLYEISNKASQI